MKTFSMMKNLYRRISLNGKTLNGNALYLVVFISFIVAVLLMLLIANNYYSQMEVLHYNAIKKLVDKTNSSVNAFIFSLSRGETENSFEQDDTIYKEISTETTLEKWGGFYTIYSHSQWKDLQYKKAALAGTYLFGEGRTGLHLADQGKYLSIAGETRLGGDCFLPALGLRSVYIDGKPYKGNKLIYGNERTSSKQLPEINPELTDWLEKALTGEQLLSDSLGNINDFNSKDSIVQTFDKKAVCYELTGISTLENIILTGKVIVHSDSAIIVRKTCKTENIILVAPKIIIEKDFAGSFQAIVRDSMLIEENVKLSYPSAVYVYNYRAKNAFCYISKNSYVEGGVLCASYLTEGGNAELTIMENSVIDGIVYCNGSVSHSGEISGSLYTNRFVLKTPRGYYENHLLDAIIDPLDQYSNIVVPVILSDNKNFGIAQWVVAE